MGTRGQRVKRERRGRGVAVPTGGPRGSETERGSQARGRLRDSAPTRLAHSSERGRGEGRRAGREKSSWAQKEAAAQIRNRIHFLFIKSDKIKINSNNSN